MQHQNFAERRWQDVKRITNTILDRSGSPENTWLLAEQYVCFILNHLATPSLSHKVPLQLLTGSTVDISAILRFVWYEPVYFQAVEPHFPSDSREDHGFFIGFAHNVGNALTYRILTRDTQKIIERSAVRSAMNPTDPNLCLDIFDGETAREFIKSKQDEKLKLIESSNQDREPEPVKTTGSDTALASAMGSEKESTPTTGSSSDDNTEDTTFQKVTPENLKPKDLVGRTILLDQDDGTKLRAKILKFVNNSKDDDIKNSQALKFLISMGKDKHEELLSYQQILDHINKDMEDTRKWNFREILAHQGPLTKEHPDYNGSSYNLKIEWESGEITYEPLNVIAIDDPTTCAAYAAKHNLLETPGWKRFSRLAKRQKKMLRMANQVKL
jgi:hypothetical protein